MATTSALNLSGRMEQLNQQRDQAEKIRIQQLQQQHERSLQQLSEAALSTTKALTASQSDSLAEALKSDRQLVMQHNKQLSGSLKQMNTELDTLSQATRKRMGWLMLWPLLMTVLLCLVMLGGSMAWASWTVSQASSQSAQILSEQRMKLKQMKSEFCSSPAGKKICILT